MCVGIEDRLTPAACGDPGSKLLIIEDMGSFNSDSDGHGGFVVAHAHIIGSGERLSRGYFVSSFPSSFNTSLLSSFFSSPFTIPCTQVAHLDTNHNTTRNGVAIRHIRAHMPIRISADIMLLSYGVINVVNRQVFLNILGYSSVFFCRSIAFDNISLI